MDTDKWVFDDSRMEGESDARRLPFQISCLVEETASVHRGLNACLQVSRSFLTSVSSSVGSMDVLIPTNRLRGGRICLTLPGKINRLSRSVSGVGHLIERVRLSALHMIDRPLCDTRS